MFICLTEADSKNVIRINLDYVISYEPAEESELCPAKTTITLDKDVAYAVMESPKEIDHMLNSLARNSVR